jgi:hypothetical protein
MSKKGVELPVTLAEIKVASIVIHAQELLSSDGREADKAAMLPLLKDSDVLEWLKKFDPALLPVKRRK